MTPGGGANEPQRDRRRLSLVEIVRIARDHPSVLESRGRGPEIKIPARLRVDAREVEAAFLSDWDIDVPSVHAVVRQRARTFLDLVLGCPLGGCDECVDQLIDAYTFVLEEKLGERDHAAPGASPPTVESVAEAEEPIDSELDLVTIREAADRLRVDARKIRRLIQRTRGEKLVVRDESGPRNSARVCLLDVRRLLGIWPSICVRERP